MFDPWHATFEAAQTAQSEWKDVGGLYTDPCAPLFQWMAAMEIEALKGRIDDGDGFSVLGAINQCVTHGLVAPEWLSYAFNRRYYSVVNCRASSWDDKLAFGRPYPKGKHLAAMRKARVHRFLVLNDVVQIKSEQPDTPVDKALFERVGKLHGLGATLTEELYYQAKKLIEAK